MQRAAVLAALLALALLAGSALGDYGGGHHRRPPAFRISGFKDITAYIFERVQTRLAKQLDITVKYVHNANEAHADVRNASYSLVSMSYDDVLSMALQENYTNVVAAWPVHGSGMALCGTVDVAAGKVNVGIDTDTGYARMLRQQLKKTLSAADYAKLHWIYAGATNERYEWLRDGRLDATLLNAPFTSLLPAGIRCQPFWTLTGVIQGTVGIVQRSALSDDTRAHRLRVFLDGFKKEMLNMLSDPAATKAGLAVFYNSSAETAANIYTSLWQPDGLLTSFCFNSTRLSNTESIFAGDTGIAVPKQRWWVKNWGCTHRDGRLN